MNASYVENSLEHRGGKLGLKMPGSDASKAYSCSWAHQMMQTHLRPNFKSTFVEASLAALPTIEVQMPPRDQTAARARYRKNGKTE